MPLLAAYTPPGVELHHTDERFIHASQTDAWETLKD
jgi:hypothetical protein